MGTVVAVLGGLVAIAVARAVARTRPEKEAQPVFHTVLALVCAVPMTAGSAHLIFTGSRGAGVFLALLTIMVIAIGFHSYLQLRAVRSEESGRESQSARD